MVHMRHRQPSPDPPNDLRAFRKLYGYDQRDVAYLMGIEGSGRISDWETGKSKPSMDNLIKLSIVFETPGDRIYFRLRRKYQKEIEERRKHLDKWRKNEKVKMVETS